MVYKNQIFLIFSALFAAKSLALGVSMQEVALYLFTVVGLNLTTAIDYIYPKRLDLNKEVDLLKLELVELKHKIEDQERDLTALKFEKGFKR